MRRQRDNFMKYQTDVLVWMLIVCWEKYSRLWNIELSLSLSLLYESLARHANLKSISAFCSGVDSARIRYFYRYTYSIPPWMQEVFIITMTTAKISFIQIHLFRQNTGVPLLWDSYPLTLSPNSNTCDRYFVFHEKHDSMFRNFNFSVSRCSRGSHIIKI